MSEAAVIAAHTPVATGPPPSAAGERRLREIDLYAEGNSFAEPDGSGGALEGLFGADGIGFKDLLDIVNPLHHLPVVGTLYRAVTGDALAPGSRVLGGTLFGGIGGFVVSLVNAVVENETGSDFGDKALALFRDDGAPHRNLADGGRGATAAADGPFAASTPAAPEPEPAPAGRAFSIFAGPPQASARTAGRSAATENPTEALIRARAAVPASRRPGIAGPSSTVAPAPAKPARGAAPNDAVAFAGPAAPQGAADTAAASASPAPGPSPRAPAPDVAVLMRDALNKYDALMKSRTGPSISSDF
ncbi:MAG: hypothetical protein GEU87_02080 [Alphaproteobacteria bacterium]|nr:hypothetical protein [Alphaproteobacteria bacterium]